MQTVRQDGESTGFFGARKKHPFIWLLCFVLVPLCIAFLAMAQDLQWIGKGNSCVKDILFVVLMLQLVLHAGIGDKLKEWLAVVVFTGWGALIVIDPLVTNWLPDTWIMSQRTHLSGMPIAETLAFLSVIGVILLGRKRKTLNKQHQKSYIFSIICVMLSARLWIAHLDYLGSHPEYTWSADGEISTVQILDSERQFVGQNWVISNVDYALTMGKVDELLLSDQKEIYWWGGLRANTRPYLMKAYVESQGVMLAYEPRPLELEWEGEINWTWMGVSSFFMVFLEVFLLAQITLECLLWHFVSKVIVPGEA